MTALWLTRYGDRTRHTANFPATARRAASMSTMIGLSLALGLELASLEEIGVKALGGGGTPASRRQAVAS